VEDWLARGLVAEWRPRIGVLHADPALPAPVEPRWLVGVPTMTALARDALDGITLRCGVRIAGLARSNTGWQLCDEQHALVGEHDVVLLTLPPAQAAPLLAASPELQQLARSAAMQPCWSVMLRLATPLPQAFDAARVDGGPLAWIARDDSKPGRSASGLHWLLQASVEWSRAHLETAPETVCALLIDAAAGTLGDIGPLVAAAVAHRWLYAFADGAVDGNGREYAWDDDQRIGLAGDWLRGARIEDAWLSGTALAGAVLRANARA
jgi:predicted NAD/FAD-dependent oxidoreductase